MPLPESFIQHLRDFGYHPRSDRHSNALAVAIVEDLVAACPLLAAQAQEGRLVYDLNMTLRFKTATWKSDLVLGTPASPARVEDTLIARVTPSTVRVAIEIKGVMTEHRKAVKNRKRDFEAHHEHVHNYSRRTIAGGVMVINSATSFMSPLRSGGLTTHGTRQAVSRNVEHCVTEMRNVTESGGGSSYGIDAKTVLVVEFDNVNLDSSRYVSHPPAPQPGDPLHYDSFIQKMCDEYGARFSTEV